MTDDCASQGRRGAGRGPPREDHHLTHHSWGCALTNGAPTLRLSEQRSGGNVGVPDGVVSMGRTGHTSPGLYEIRVQGRLEPRWATWFDGFSVGSQPDGTTVIRGSVVDQAALHGLLQSLGDLGLPLVSVTRPQDDTSATPTGRDDGTAEPPPADTAKEEPQ